MSYFQTKQIQRCSKFDRDRTSMEKTPNDNKLTSTC